MRLVTNKTQLFLSCVFVFVYVFVFVFAFHWLRSRETCGAVCAAQSESRELVLTNKEQLISSCPHFSRGEPPNTNTHTNTNTNIKANTHKNTETKRKYWLPPKNSWSGVLASCLLLGRPPGGANIIALTLSVLYYWVGWVTSDFALDKQGTEHQHIEMGIRERFIKRNRQTYRYGGICGGGIFWPWSCHFFLTLRPDLEDYFKCMT